MIELLSSLQVKLFTKYEWLRMVLDNCYRSTNGIKTNLHPVKSKGPQQGHKKHKKQRIIPGCLGGRWTGFTQRLLDGHSGWKEHEHQNQCMGSDPHPETLYIPISVYFQSIVGSATSKPGDFFEIKFVCLNHIIV